MESKEYDKIIPSVQRTHGRLKTLKAKMNDDLKKLDKEKGDILKQIKDFRKLIDNELDRLEKSVSDDIHARYTNLDREIKSNIKSLEDMLTNLEASLKKLENMNVYNESDIFIHVKLGETRKSNGKSLLQEIKGSHVKATMLFMENKELEEFMKSVEVFGKIEEREEDTDTDDDSNDDSSDDSSDESDANSSVNSSDNKLGPFDESNDNLRDALEVNLVDYSFENMNMFGGDFYP